MDSSASSNFDPNALTFRNYLTRPLQHSSNPQSVPNIPSYQELSVLQQELLYLSEKAATRHEKYANELARLDGGANFSQSKDSSVSSTPNSSASAATFNSASQGLSHTPSAGANTSNAARSSASPNTSSPSSFSSSSRAGGPSGALTQGAGGSPALVKLGVVTLKLKRSDAAGTCGIEFKD
ncbi:hypothetical protein BC939DRAFT_41778 [Gamsiella multidivaricata]|uniref:uncharacterized protein n=1 Tax=Gamsiella multidivaricata TaxID=101098 RepID=UPI00221FD53A|nr:uncharacterized protein BC939DRAFT_41778 [Gamsiella multidivaricata]KAI7816551.1 hypothetical protein BC939DRAFT_41778 [Gamsiella multidivaricata]